MQSYSEQPESSINIANNISAYQSLIEEFPHVSADLVYNVLNDCRQNYHSARQSLIDLMGNDP